MFLHKLSGFRKPALALMLALMPGLLLSMPPATAALQLAELKTDEVHALRESGEILPLEDILRRVRDIQPGRVIEIELERDDGRYIYELEVVDDHGVVWDIDIDARSGDLIERERDD